MRRKHRSARGTRRVAIFHVQRTATECENKTVVVVSQQCETSREAREQRRVQSLLVITYNL